MTTRALLREPNSGRWLHFCDLREIVQTARLDEVRQCLDAIERKVETEGLHAVGFVAYEAAPAFDRALRVDPAKNGLLIWFGLFAPPVVLNQLPAAPDSSFIMNAWKPSITQSDYEAHVDAIRQAIASGETYQVNYTFRLRQVLAAGQSASDYATELFARLATAQPSPYAALIDAENFVICSASPELFFQLDGADIATQPMKGTASRGLSYAQDLAAARELAASEKNRAENAMIVDMMRNDLGRIAEVGSVRVDELFRVDRYPTLWQMTSRITARTTASLAEIFAALFPCASVTGAPKASAMRIIARSETAPRHVYTGSIGHIAPRRKAIFNVAIRTIVLSKHKPLAEYGVGGGVVWDSTPRGEYRECLLKAAILTAPSIPEFSLLETMLHEPGKGYYLLDYHLRRIGESAEYFNFAPPLTARSALADFATTLSNDPQRVRLLASRDGQCTCEARPLAADELPDPILLELAAEPIDAGDPFLYHKTTHREVYAKALAGCRAGHDALLYNARREVTETSRANVVARIGQHLYTPPVACGLLPGTFRQRLLDEGTITERIITLDMLAECEELFVINSVRRWGRATIIV
jgi:para-aminobenzoate synthetase/4-amino-4-deoxychorismate lyase